MAERKSQHSLAKMGKVGRKPWIPDVKKWEKACRVFAHDKQMIKHFDICQETFYSFLDKQRCLEEEGKKAEYLEIYKRVRFEVKEKISDAFLNKVADGDPSSIIFGMKAYNGLLEEKDIKHIELKKVEVAFKTKQFLTSMAKEFNLTYEELDKFADKYFKESKLDDI